MTHKKYSVLILCPILKILAYFQARPQLQSTLSLLNLGYQTDQMILYKSLQCFSIRCVLQGGQSDHLNYSTALISPVLSIDLYCNFFLPTSLFVTCSLDSRLSESLFATACLTSDDYQELFLINLVPEIRTTTHQE